MDKEFCQCDTGVPFPVESDDQQKTKTPKNEMKFKKKEKKKAIFWGNNGNKKLMGRRNLYMIRFQANKICHVNVKE